MIIGATFAINKKLVSATAAASQPTCCFKKRSAMGMNTAKTNGKKIASVIAVNESMLN